MATHLDALAIRARLGREQWGPPIGFGPDGWAYRARRERGSVIVSCASGLDEDDPGTLWAHASVAFEARMPTYADLARLHHAVWPSGHSVQVFVPEGAHVNIHRHALHLWGRLDGTRFTPDFGRYGMV